MVWKFPDKVDAYPMAFHNALDSLRELGPDPCRVILQARERDIRTLAREFQAFVRAMRACPGHKYHGVAVSNNFRVKLADWPLIGQRKPTVYAYPSAARDVEMLRNLADLG